MGSDELRRRALVSDPRRWRGWGVRSAVVLALLAGGCAVAPVAGPPPAVPPEEPSARVVLGEQMPSRLPRAVPGTPAADGTEFPAAKPAETPPPVVPAPRPVEVPVAVRQEPAPPEESPAELSPVPQDEPPAAAQRAPVVDPEREAPPPEPAGWAIPERPEISAVLAEFTGRGRRSVARALERAEDYLPMIRRVLAEEELPPELACLPMVESHYLVDARSSAGAVGLWQFIDTTARGSGLRVDWWVDERLDPELATRAAARHLQELYLRFGDWELALAAYNAGPGGVARALERSGAEGFWGLAEGGWLRAETRRYVPKFYASIHITEDPARFGFGTETAGDPAQKYDTVPVAAPVDLYTVARTAGISVGKLRVLNPALKRYCTPPGVGAYPLRVPAGEGAQVAAALAGLGPEERTEFLRYRVAAGDSLWSIARRFDTHPTAIAELNRVTDPRLLRPGQQLVVPSRRGRAGLKDHGTAADRTAGAVGYRVQPGDTVAGIARLHGVAVADVLRWNGLGPQGLIRPGDQLFVGSSAVVTEGGVAGARVHVVENGDTLWGISRRYGVPLQELRRANELGPEAVLRPGDELVVGAPGGSGG